MGPQYNDRNQRIAAWAAAAAEESESAAPTDPEARDLHDQEKAQRIEHEDLCRENKQVKCSAMVRLESDCRLIRDVFLRLDSQGRPLTLANMAEYWHCLR